MIGLFLYRGRVLPRPIAMVFWGILAIGTVSLTSCSSVPTNSAALAPAPQSPAGSVNAEKVAAGNPPANDAGTSKPTQTSPQKPQLIKTAEISLRLDSIDQMVVKLRRLVQSKQGDIYNFQDNQPQENSQRRRASLVLKVPTTSLDETVAEIVKLGKVQSQTIKSSDVTQQLIDSTARLKNLRQQEELTRKIMERSGSIKDVLAVSQQLSEIREQIEQLDATAKNLQQQVAYATINLQVEETQSVNPASDGLGVQIQETWKNSTQTAGGLATNIGLSLLWLIPFMPFLAIGAGGFYYYYWRRRPQPVIEILSEEPTSLDN